MPPGVPARAACEGRLGPTRGRCGRPRIFPHDEPAVTMSLADALAGYGVHVILLAAGLTIGLIAVTR